LFFKLLFDVKLIYSIQVLGSWLWGSRLFFFFSGGAKLPNGSSEYRRHELAIGGLGVCPQEMFKIGVPEIAFPAF
jgi:hypothetical protein